MNSRLRSISCLWPGVFFVKTGDFYVEGTLDPGPGSPRCDAKLNRRVTQFASENNESVRRTLSGLRSQNNIWAWMIPNAIQMPGGPFRRIRRTSASMRSSFLLTGPFSGENAHTHVHAAVQKCASEDVAVPTVQCCKRQMPEKLKGCLG